MERQEAQQALLAGTSREHGLVPSWELVWREGVDITHQPPSSGGWPCSKDLSGGWGEAIRQRYLAWQTEALVEQDGFA